MVYYASVSVCSWAPVREKIIIRIIGQPINRTLLKRQIPLFFISLQKGQEIFFSTIGGKTIIWPYDVALLMYFPTNNFSNKSTQILQKRWSFILPLYDY